VSDVYSGYNKAIREANELRVAEGKPAISAAFCNSHARRNFKASAHEAPVEAEYMVAKYAEIYALNDKTKEVAEDAQYAIRQQMQPIFEEMKSYAQSQIELFSSKSQICRKIKGFLSIITQAKDSCVAPSWEEKHGTARTPQQAQRRCRHTLRSLSHVNSMG
jgi:hypothetical protein